MESETRRQANASRASCCFPHYESTSCMQEAGVPTRADTATQKFASDLRRHLLASPSLKGDRQKAGEEERHLRSFWRAARPCYSARIGSSFPQGCDGGRASTKKSNGTRHPTRNASYGFWNLQALQKVLPVAPLSVLWKGKVIAKATIARRHFLPPLRA